MKQTTKLKLQIFAIDVFDLITFLTFVLGIVLFVRFFIFNPYTVEGASMEPVFSDNDFIVVDKITSRRGELKRGDVVVFVPKGRNIPFIKRIIGLPGETVKVENGEVIVCDKNEVCETLIEPYLPQGLETFTSQCGVDEFVADDTGYIVFGDNRPHSTDSRCCFDNIGGQSCTTEGANYLVQPKDMIGKVMVKIYPHMEAFW